MEIGQGFNHLRWHLLKIDVYFKYWQIIIDILVEGIFDLPIICADIKAMHLLRAAMAFLFL